MKWVQMGVHKPSLGVFHKGHYANLETRALMEVRIPMKPDAYSKVKPDTYSDFIPDSVPI